MTHPSLSQGTRDGSGWLAITETTDANRKMDALDALRMIAEPVWHEIRTGRSYFRETVFFKILEVAEVDQVTYGRVSAGRGLPRPKPWNPIVRSSVYG